MMLFDRRFMLEKVPLVKMADGKRVPLMEAVRSPEPYENSQTVRTASATLAVAYADGGKGAILAGLKEVMALVSADDSDMGAVVSGPAAGDTFTNSTGMKLVWIPAGTFWMGSRDSVAEVVEKSNYDGKQPFSNEHPQHRVTLTHGFWMGVTETTQYQYGNIAGVKPRSGIMGDDQPAEVTVYEAVAFCKKLSDKEGKTYRLPTEAEWEYACRAGTTTPFNTGETISVNQANYYGKGVYGNGSTGTFLGKPMPVGSFTPNAFGLYDMHGNVVEWCSDWYLGGYSNNPAENPTGPSSGRHHVYRGGSYTYAPVFCRSACRGLYRSIDRGSHHGFRIVLNSN